jgi:hypothetical protein
MCLICGSRSVPAGRDGRGSGPTARPPARQARRFTSTCSSRSHTIAPPSGLIVAISSHAASEHGIDLYRGRHEAPRAHFPASASAAARPRVAAWIDEYNTTRRHSATGMTSPGRFRGLWVPETEPSVACQEHETTLKGFSRAHGLWREFRDRFTPGDG